MALGAHEGEGHQFQRQSGDVCPLIDLYGPKKVRQFLGIHAGIVHLAYGRQNVTGVNFSGWIPLRVSVSNGVAENLSGRLQGALGNVARAGVPQLL